ncbi:potassium transporter TrkG [Actinomyces sp. F1_1611]
MGIRRHRGSLPDGSRKEWRTHRWLVPGRNSNPVRVLPPPHSRSRVKWWQVHRRVARWFEHLAQRSPARATLLVFLAIITAITGLLSLPIATTSGERAPFIDALFTAVSAVCVTGLTTVDTATYWSHFGQGVMVLGVFIGGLGVMTLASLLALVVSSHLGLTQRMLASSATGSRGMSDVGQILTNVMMVSLVVEGGVFVALSLRFLTLGFTVPDALWSGLFMAISSFNNAGFVNLEGGAASFVGDWGFLLPIILAATVGALGFPVLNDFIRNPRKPRRWTLHSKMTLSVFGGLFFLSVVSTAVLEWNNPGTFGHLAGSEKVLNSLLSGINSRSLGISAIDTSAQESTTIFLTGIFMFIGGGSASTAGGIKVTTFAVLFLAVLAEAKGSHDVEVYGRRLRFGTVRLAVSVLFISTAMVLLAAFLLLAMTNLPLEAVIFETISAFGTVGLSLGITPHLPAAAKAVLVFLMFAGRLGPMTFATALALREKSRLVRMPESRPIVG